MLCVRRISLDVILVEKAQAEGVDVRLHTRVTGLVEKDGRVAGVQVAARDGSPSTITADLVVGADGRLSTIARLVGSRRYHVLPSDAPEPWSYFQRRAARGRGGALYHRPATSSSSPPDRNDLFLVASCPRSSKARVTAPTARARSTARWRPASRLRPPRGREARVNKFRGLTRFEGYFRGVRAGLGARGRPGHFKEPDAGQGISDALRQVDKLSAAIVRGISSPEAARRRAAPLVALARQGLDPALWFCLTWWAARAISPVRLEIMRAVAADEEWRKDFLDIFCHRRYPRRSQPRHARRASARRWRTRPKGRARSATLRHRAWKLRRRLAAWFPRVTEKAAVDEPHFDHQPSAA